MADIHKESDSASLIEFKIKKNDNQYYYCLSFKDVFCFTKLA